ncbi:hypothetical protein H1C71_042002 [Ictidomys tridecemlineatus]|nr:hypothetical protein H1C71_042002 [Ictidomys tridecemlineatus]
MAVECILTYHIYMGYNFPFLWLYMMRSHTDCVFMYAHRKVMSNSFYYLSYFHPPSLSFIPVFLIQSTSIVPSPHLTHCVLASSYQREHLAFGVLGLVYFT